MSVRQNVRTPVGSDACQPARKPLHQLAGRLGPLGRVGARPSRIASSSWAACAGSMPSHVGRSPVGGSPVSSVKAVAARE